MTSGKKSQKTTDERQFIALDPGVKADLEELGKFKDTYNDVVRNLIEFWKKNH